MTLTELAKHPRRELERVFAAGSQPDIGSLVGWEFRGFNPPAFAKPLRIERFVKGFFGTPDRAEGYNVFVGQRDWSRRRNRRHGYFTVAPPPGRFAGTVLLDYGASARNVRANPERLLRDYLVLPEPGNDDLILGKAFLRLGALVPVSFFILERDREAT